MGVVLPLRSLDPHRQCSSTPCICVTLRITWLRASIVNAFATKHAVLLLYPSQQVCRRADRALWRSPAHQAMRWCVAIFLRVRAIFPIYLGPWRCRIRFVDASHLGSSSRSLLLKSVCAEAFWRAVVAVHLSGHFRPLACNKMTPTLYINHYFHLPTSSTSCMPTSTRSQRRCAPPCHTLSHRTAPHTLAQARTHAQRTHARTHA